MKVLVICSGGLDSTTLVYDAVEKNGDTVGMVTFDYGQRHKWEIEHAKRTATKLRIQHFIVTLPIGQLLPGSALTDATVSVPEKDYTEETLAVTVVPNRNAIMLSVAAGIANAHGYQTVYAGMHGADHAVYADCRPEFVNAFSAAMELACGITIQAPYVMLDKADIASIGARLKVPYEDTYSCYNGREKHCGVCSTCRERHRAITAALISDPTSYEQSPQVSDAA